MLISATNGRGAMSSITQWFQDAVAHHQAGRLDAAEQLYRQVLAASPAHGDSWQLLGTLAYQQGKYAEAVEHIRRALDLGLRHAGVLSNLGAAYRALGRDAEAVATLEQALQLDPRVPGAWNNLANSCKQLGRTADARHAYGRAIELDPTFADAHDNLARLLQNENDVDGAIFHYREALRRKPVNPRSHNNLGTLLLARGLVAEALGEFDTAIEQQPTYARAWNNRGTALRELGRPHDAEAAYRRALECDATLVEAANNLASTLGAQGRCDEALEVQHRAVEQAPDQPQIHSNYLMLLQYRPGITLAELFEAHDQWNRRHGMPVEPARVAWPHSRDPGRRLRVGFISADLGRHPVGCIMLPLLKHASRDAFEFCCYSNRTMHDPLQAELRQLSDRWRDVSPLTDEQLHARVREDQVDILFDLSGHSAHNRLAVFARRAAPVQVTWAGYQATTGLSAIDYLLTDEAMVPHGAETFFRERVVRLSGAAWCCAIENPPVDPGPPPMLSRGEVTFGSFNNASKVSPAVVELWGRILAAVPDSRLILKYRGFDEPGVVARYQRHFAQWGITGERLLFRGQTPFEAMLGEYREIDIALDPFPFGGGMTSLIALWMGVPVVTLPGETIAGRQTLSMLAAAGERGIVANNADDYVAIAARLAGDPARLSALRQTLRERIMRTAFLSPAKFVPVWSAAVRRMWSEWCAQEP